MGNNAESRFLSTLNGYKETGKGIVKKMIIGTVATGIALGNDGEAFGKKMTIDAGANESVKTTNYSQQRKQEIEKRSRIRIIGDDTYRSSEGEGRQKVLNGTAGEIGEEIEDMTTEKKFEIFEKKAEKLREEFVKHIQSREYFEALTRECGDDKIKALREQQYRMKNIKEVDIIFMEHNDLENEYLSFMKEENPIVNALKQYLADNSSNAIRTLNKNLDIFFRGNPLGMREKERNSFVLSCMSLKELPETEQKIILKKIHDEFYKKNLPNASAFYKPLKHKIYVDIDTDNIETKIWHELSHASNRYEYGFKMSDDIKNTFLSSYIYDPHKTDQENFYLGTPEEMLARKKQFDRDLEILGLKKYGERFTEDNLEKILSPQNVKNLSDGSIELLNSLTDPKMSQKDNRRRIANFLNSIAKNDRKEEGAKAV